MPLRKLRRALRRRCPSGIGSSPRAALSIAITAALSIFSAAPDALAGDILRGGAPTGARPSSAGVNAANPAMQSRAGANARDALARNAQTLKAMQSMQSAARAAARQAPANVGLTRNGIQLPRVPNGLVIGGLQVAPGVPAKLAQPQPGENPALWRGALLPKEGKAGGQPTVTIKQTSSQAVLNWKTFNVGKETTVNFDQKIGTQKDGSNNWIAINKIQDPSGVPSQILGQIKGDGAVYLINPNGILFGGSSQINLHSFVASSLPINDNLLSRGLLNNPDAQFLFSGLDIPAGANGTPAFTPPAPATPNSRFGDVVVEPGAQLSSPTTDAHVGGRVALIGANVVNGGTISTPDGQTILAAGLQVGLAAHTSSDPSLRGLDAAVGAVQTTGQALYAGSATNSGFIAAARGSITVTGKNVLQLGAVASTTSVSLNGRIDLTANFNAAPYPTSSTGSGSQAQDHPAFLFQSTGTVTLGQGSVTTIIPEYASEERVVGTQLALASQVNVQGKALHLQADSSIFAPSANVALSAGIWKYQGGALPTSPFVFSGGQIYLDRGATINVAGSADIAAPMTENILSVELRGSELADSPLQRDSLFRGSTIQVDIRQTGVFDGRVWVGTPLADASGYVGLVERTVGELTTPGGTVKLRAGESVVMQAGSKIDVSGGWVNFQEGMVQTTRVMSGGRLLDISQATPDMVYDGIYTGTFTVEVPKYGFVQTYTNPLAMTGAHFEPGYTFGASGGQINITAPSMALDGAMLGYTIAGPRQRTVAPAPSSISLAFQAQQPVAPLFPTISPTPPTIVFEPGATAMAAAPFALDPAGEPLPLRADRRAKVSLDPALLTENGFGILAVENSDGDIIVPRGVSLETQAGGSITLNGANITIFGNVTAPAGALSFRTFDISPSVIAAIEAQPDGAETPLANLNRGNFILGSDSTLSTAGLLVDDRIGAEDFGTLPFAIDGGRITINSFSANLAAGSTIDVSGGVAVSLGNKFTYGRGGSISIAAGQAAQTTQNAILAGVIGGHLELHSNLLGYSSVQGGALSILAPTIQIGGTTSNPDTLLLTPQFFQHGGFASYTLHGLGAKTGVPNEYVPAISVAPGTLLEPLALGAYAFSGANGLEMRPMFTPEGVRSPASLSLAAVGVRDNFTKLPIFRGDLVFGEGALIRTDARASVSLSGETVAVLGSIDAPGGAITIAGGKDSNTIFPEKAGLNAALTTVYLGPSTFLSTAGAVVYTADARGLRTGNVLAGGTISVSGNIVAATGATLDVSGTSGLLDLPLSMTATADVLFAQPMAGTFRGNAMAAARVDSNAGSITLAGAQALFTDATLLAHAGGPMGAGGSLTVSSGRFIPQGSGIQPTPLDITLTVTPGSPNLPVLGANPGQVIGNVVLGVGGQTITGQGQFGVNRLAFAGFDALTLKGTVDFQGDIAITMPRQLSVADGGVIFANGDVRLAAPHVVLGTAFRPPFAPQESKAPFTVGTAPFTFQPTYGHGTLTVTGDLIDIGNLSLQGIGRASFFADGGDIRGDGTLSMSGALSLRAAQIYPPTAVSFTIAVSDHEINSTPRLGSVTIIGSGVSPLPLSAGGELNVYGSVIEQGGTLRAPQGTINLGWDGTGEAPVNLITGQAVPETKTLTLAAGSVTSVSGIDPLTGLTPVIPYGLNINGSSWIDPMGVDITAGGVPTKNINVAATAVLDQAGSMLDLRGGGDLFSFRFVKGIGGSQDILASTTSFAIIPGYGADYAPFAPFTTGSLTGNLGDANGYVNGSLRVGDRIHLDGSTGLPAGDYTLLPARYAVIPGAFLVTPKSGRPIGVTMALADGSSLVSGYRFNSAHEGAPALHTMFSVAPVDVVLERAQYSLYTANEFLTEGALKNGLAAPRLPMDGGHLVLQATAAMTLKGKVAAQATGLGRGGLVDLSSPVDIVITGQNGSAAAGSLVLNAADLSAFGAESLLIGGIRELGPNGATVTVTTGRLTVDNAGTPLTAPDIILVAKQNLTLAPGADIRSTGSLTGADPLFLGTANVAGSGDGVLIRVSADPGAQVNRTSVSNSTVPSLEIGAGARLTGASLILDSTANTTLAPSALLRSSVISLNSGQISILLDGSTVAPPATGLVLAGQALASIQSAKSLSLLSYSTIDLYGAGLLTLPGRLSLSAGEIRGLGNDGGAVTIAAQSIQLDNGRNGAAPTVLPATTSGTLAFTANSIRLGQNQLAINGYTLVELNSSGGLLVQGAGGLSTQQALTITAPLIAGSRAAAHSIIAGGALILESASGTKAAIQPGLGVSLTLQGSSVLANSNVSLPSGSLTLRATSGDLTVGGNLSVAGTAQNFFDLTRFTDAGEIMLVSDTGSVTVAAEGNLNVSAPGLADAGKITVSARANTGAFNLAGTVAGRGNTGGSFVLDVVTVPNNSLAALNGTLDLGGFNELRSFRLRTGDVLVDGTAKARHFNVSADQGSINVSGIIDASGRTGGTIALSAANNLVLGPSARLTVAAEVFNAAGKGGAITLESGAPINGLFNSGATLDLQTGAQIDLSVAANSPTSQNLGHFTGTLHLRAPQTSSQTEVQINAINSTITGASNILVEGYRIFTLAGGLITTAVQNAVRANGVAFAGNTTAITNRLFANNAALIPQAIIAPGAEIINRTGDLTLGTTTSTATSDWDLSTFRFGPRNVPGVLTLRAAGNLVFLNALSDGFASSAYTAQLLAPSSTLPANAQSYSYRLVAGADFSAADFHQVRPLSGLAATAGSLLLGKDGGTNSSPGSASAQTRDVVGNRFQVIRTGSGSIEIAAARDVKLLNQFAGIYSAGTRLASPTTVLNAGDFDLPSLDVLGDQGQLGSPQQFSPGYLPQYSLGGGNITIAAQGDITRQTLIGTDLVADSTRQMPTNWLYRRGFVDPATGVSGAASRGDIASTTWWIDFSNFFEGVGALGGGNVTLTAGRDIANVDAVIPTNARMAGKGAAGTLAPSAANLIELGGGDLVIRAGRDIDGGVYYVERGQGTLSAGNSIHTNATRSPSLTLITGEAPLSPETWLPTTLFLGKGSFDVTARGDVLLGPVANPFLLPGGMSNTFWYKTYFNTYASTNAVNVSSLGGSVTLRTETTLPSEAASAPILQAWYQNQLLLVTTDPASASFYQPWLRLNESSVQPFVTNFSILPSTLRATAFSGDINLAGDLTLFPSPTGTIELAASGSIKGLQPTGFTNALITDQTVRAWSSSTINLSDANPASLPGIASPFAYQTIAGLVRTNAQNTGDNFLSTITAAFAETGSTAGAASVLQAKQALHASDILHAGDTSPTRLYAQSGDISGLTLFSPKFTRLIAGNDVTDLALYLQNTSENDISVVTAGRDLIAYNANSPLRISAQAAGNALDFRSGTLAGDLQISGPGTLEVLTGRHLDLGIGPNNPDGTGLGIVSIGNGRNPALPFEGADLVVAAGMSPAITLGSKAKDYQAMVDQIDASKLDQYLTDVTANREGGSLTKAEFDKLPAEEQALIATDIFFLVLRDAGRDFETTGNYDSGFAAIDALFRKPNPQGGDISLTAREIKTRSGGDISILAPAGELRVGFDVAGNQPLDQGILTEAGGNISIFTDGDVTVGTSRIFTLRGGNEIIWSSNGDIAAGSSAKTVQSAPPTRVLIDAQTADVKTDLAGLATGGGIGVLATVANVPPGDVSLIAPTGTVDAGDAGIRASGNVTIAATTVLNASNIAASGSTSGAPTSAPAAAPSLARVAAPSNNNSAGNSAAAEAARQAQSQPAAVEEAASLFTVEVIGYGGGAPTPEEDEEEKKKRRVPVQNPPVEPALPTPAEPAAPADPAA